MQAVPARSRRRSKGLTIAVVLNAVALASMSMAGANETPDTDPDTVLTATAPATPGVTPAPTLIPISPDEPPTTAAPAVVATTAGVAENPDTATTPAAAAPNNPDTAAGAPPNPDTATPTAAAALATAAATPKSPNKPDTAAGAPNNPDIPDAPDAETPEDQSEEAVEAAITEYPIAFPVDGTHSFSDSWGAPRSNGRTHKGIDIFAAKGTPVVAAADGKVIRISKGTRAGRYIVVEHSGGWRSYYLHLNNDTEGTDDGLRDELPAGIAVGAVVEAGDILDFVGDSGNAEGTPPHLHFEIHASDGKATNPFPHLRAALLADPLLEGPPVVSAVAAPAPTEPTIVGENVVFVGKLDPGGGFAADVTVHAATAYLGTWGRPNACPASGVRMIDVSDPEQPTRLGEIASGTEFPETSTDSVWVGAVETTAFTGDLAVVAVRLCDTSERSRLQDAVRGLALYDVTDPTAPVLLSTFSSGARTQGIHELDVVAHDDGSLLVAATALQSERHTDGAAGDLRIVDITDPTVPVALADWDLRRDGPIELVDEMLAAVYDDLELHIHDATWTEDGTGLWLAAWDAGVVLLDTTDPAQPSMVTAFGFDPETEGNAHSVAADSAAGLLIRNDQDLINADVGRHGPGWGGQRFYDVSDPTAVVELSTFMTERATPDSRGSARHTDGRYSAHNAQIVDGIEYVAWYSDGVRIVDISDPTAPGELGSFVPPARVDPQGYWDAPDGTRAFAMVWGVHVADDLIYVSDMHSGLWIVRYISPEPEMEAASGRPKL